MKGFLRRLRGIIGTGFTWAVGFIAFMAGITALMGEFEFFLDFLPSLTIMGFMMGGAFGGILAFTERSRRLDDLSLWRVALWGAVGGSLAVGAISLIVGDFPSWQGWSIPTALSAAFAAGHVAIARRGDTELIEGDDEPLPALEGE